MRAYQTFPRLAGFAFGSGCLPDRKGHLGAVFQTSPSFFLPSVSDLKPQLPLRRQPVAECLFTVPDPLAASTVGLPSR